MIYKCALCETESESQSAISNHFRRKHPVEYSLKKLNKPYKHDAPISQSTELTRELMQYLLAKENSEIDSLFRFFDQYRLESDLPCSVHDLCAKVLAPRLRYDRMVWYWARESEPMDVTRNDVRLLSDRYCRGYVQYLVDRCMANQKLNNTLRAFLANYQLYSQDAIKELFQLALKAGS